MEAHSILIPEIEISLYIKLWQWKIEVSDIRETLLKEYTVSVDENRYNQ
jgi:hypothetical protein